MMMIPYMNHIMKMSDMNFDLKTVSIALGLLQVGNKLVLDCVQTVQLTLNRIVYHPILNPRFNVFNFCLIKLARCLIIYPPNSDEISVLK